MANLKTSIIVVNEFSVPLPGGKGSRGATPGAYVERYMARDGATETLAPIQRQRTDDFILRYMARESAVEHAPGIGAAKAEMKQAQGLGGVAFGYGSISLSDEQLRAASRDLQRLFDSGHTVMKTVLSFDEEYLRETGIIDKDFHLEGPGDYRGHIDQMKLRMGIMRGMDKMSAGTAGFDDLRYTAVIQVDTEHVHCHIAAIDAGVGQITKDGTQRGKLLDRHKARLRRGVDAYLDEKQAVARLSSAVGYERRNVTTYIKRWAHETMREESLPQFLLACLPEDRSLWRAGTNDRSMRRANQLVTEMVTETLDRADSPMPQARASIQEYADRRREREGLSQEQWAKIVTDGENQVIERCVNGVYGMLRGLPADELRIRTPMLEVMSMDERELARLSAQRSEDIAADDDVATFGYRLRTYSSRLKHHREQTQKYRELTRVWEKADEAGAALPESRPAYDFYRFETGYHRQLMSKYQHFLPTFGDEDRFADAQGEVADYGQRLLSLMSLRQDASLQRMRDEDEAERMGREIYGQPGGRHLTRGSAGRSVIDARIKTMTTVHEAKVASLRADLSEAGLVLRATTPDEQVAGRGQQIIEPGSFDDFSEVKALDLHHLGYDFFSDVEISKTSFERFDKAASRRRSLLRGTVDWFEISGQSDSISELPVDDVVAMSKFATSVSPDGQGRLWLPSRYAELRAAEASASVRRSATTSLDSGLVVRVRNEVDHAVMDSLPGQMDPELGE